MSHHDFTLTWKGYICGLRHEIVVRKCTLSPLKHKAWKKNQLPTLYKVLTIVEVPKNHFSYVKNHFSYVKVLHCSNSISPPNCEQCFCRSSRHWKKGTTRDLGHPLVMMVNVFNRRITRWDVLLSSMEVVVEFLFDVKYIWNCCFQ